jgi:alpha-galactosidase
MGWNSWNTFGCDIDAAFIRSTADATVRSGVKEAGYAYVNIDDCWMAEERGPEGELQPNPKTFPQGLEVLADYVHAQGLKVGIYSSAGTEICQGLPGSIGYERPDAQLFAQWGINYLKFENCGDHRGESAPKRYQAMSKAPDATSRPIVFSVCEWGRNNPWKWAAEVGGNLWRTTGDIGACFKRPFREGFPAWKNTVLEILDQQVGLAKHAGPGH